METTTSEDRIPAEVDSLLQEFSQIFETPAELPLLRGHKHSIILKEGAQLVCQSPHRYPFYQKN